MACNYSDEVHQYIGDKWSLENNYKLKPIIDNLMNNSHIRRIGERPLVLRYVENTEIVNGL